MNNTQLRNIYQIHIACYMHMDLLSWIATYGKSFGIIWDRITNDNIDTNLLDRVYSSLFNIQL